MVFGDTVKSGMGRRGSNRTPIEFSIASKLLKIGALIRITIRKVWISLAGGYPHVALFQQVHEKLSAVPLKY